MVFAFEKITLVDAFIIKTYVFSTHPYTSRNKM